MENNDDIQDFFKKCNRIFVSVNTILFATGKIFILVRIHKSCIVYFEKICCADRSWKFIFWSWKSHGKSLLKKNGHHGCRNGLMQSVPRNLTFVCENDIL